MISSVPAEPVRAAWVRERRRPLVAAWPLADSGDLERSQAGWTQVPTGLRERRTVAWRRRAAVVPPRRAEWAQPVPRVAWARPAVSARRADLPQPVDLLQRVAWAGAVELARPADSGPRVDSGPRAVSAARRAAASETVASVIQVASAIATACARAPGIVVRTTVVFAEAAGPAAEAEAVAAPCIPRRAAPIRASRAASAPSIRTAAPSTGTVPASRTSRSTAAAPAEVDDRLSRDVARTPRLTDRLTLSESVDPRFSRRTHVARGLLCLSLR